jgi:hypothetical protein
LSAAISEDRPPHGCFSKTKGLRKHRLDLKSVEEADVFWGIVPTGEELPEVEKKDGRYVVA